MKKYRNRVESSKQNRTYVLVHGAWVGGWVWEQVADGLRAASHTVYAPSLTGLGDRAHLLQSDIDLDTHTDDVVTLMESEGLTKVVLVGWSYGGMVISNVLARAKSRIVSMVYLDAYVPAPGRSAASYTAANSVETLLELAAEGRHIPPLPLERLGLSDPTFIDRFAQRLSPQPVMTFLQPSKAHEVKPDIPHTFILAGANPSPTFRPFYQMLRDDPLASTAVLDTGHSMMITDPEGTVAALANAL